MSSLKETQRGTKMLMYSSKVIPLSDVISEFFDKGVDNLFNAKPYSMIPKYPKSNILFNKDKGWKIELALAGFKKDNIKIVIEEGVLSVTGEKVKGDTEDYEVLPQNHGISENNFTYSIRLSEKIDVNKISSQFEDGILSVYFPFKEEAKPVKKMIDIK